MRLLLITNDYPPKPGGIQQWTANLLGGMDAEVRVLAPRDGAADSTQRGESVVRRSNKKVMLPTPAIGRWVVSEIADFQPDAVLFGAPHPLPLLIKRIRRSYGGVIGVMSHGAEVTLPAAVPVVRQWLGAVLRRADVLMAVSEYTASKVSKMTKRHVNVVGAGVDVEVFTPGGKEGGLVVGCVSRFVPRKGQGRVIRAAAVLRQEGIDVSVLLVGTGRKEQSLRRLSARLEVPVDFAIDVPWASLPAAYRQMDIFAMPSKSRWFGLEVEGLGIVYLEAAACGLPVIAGHSGGAPEAIVPGATGLLASSTESLTEALHVLLHDAARRAEYGSAGRDRVVADCTWDRVADRVLQALEIDREAGAGLDKPPNRR